MSILRAVLRREPKSARDPPTLKLLRTRKETGEADCDQIFQQGDENVFDVQSGDYFSPDLVTGKCSDHSTDGTENRAEHPPLIASNPVDAGAAKTAHENASDQRHGGSSFRS